MSSERAGTGSGVRLKSEREGAGMRKFSEKVNARPSETLAERLLYCAGILHVGGWMSDTERKRVHARMMKQKAKEERLRERKAGA